MITVEKLEKGTYFDDAFKISFRYDPTTVAKVKELAERRYLPEDRAWEIPAHELPALIEKVGLSNIKSEEAVVQALNTKEIEDKREATQERLKGIKPVRDFDFKTAPLPHQIEAFNYGMEKNSLLIGDEQGLGKTKESIDICVARKKELIKTLIVCGVNSVKYNWEKEIQIHSNEGCVMVDGKTMDVRVQQLNDWYRGSSYFGVINIESLRNEKIQDALYLGIKDGYIGAIIVDEIHKAKNGGSQQGKALRFLKAPVKIGLSGTPMNKAEDLWNILTWLGVERRSFYSFRNAYCTMGGFGGYKVIGYKNLDREFVDGVGIPIGNYVSQYDGNFNLSIVDHWLKEVKGVKYYFRYMDDMVIFGSSKEELHKLKRELDEFMAVNLKQVLKHNWQVFPTKVRGVDFVGYRFFGEYTLLRKSTCKTFKRRMLSISSKRENNVSPTYSEWCSFNSYVGWLQHCDSFRLYQKYVEPNVEYMHNYYLKEVKGNAEICKRKNYSGERKAS